MNDKHTQEAIATMQEAVDMMRKAIEALRKVQDGRQDTKFYKTAAIVAGAVRDGALDARFRQACITKRISKAEKTRYEKFGVVGFRSLPGLYHDMRISPEDWEGTLRQELFSAAKRDPSISLLRGRVGFWARSTDYFLIRAGDDERRFLEHLTRRT